MLNFFSRVIIVVLGSLGLIFSYQNCAGQDPQSFSSTPNSSTTTLNTCQDCFPTPTTNTAGNTSACAHQYFNGKQVTKNGVLLRDFIPHDFSATASYSAETRQEASVRLAVSASFSLDDADIIEIYRDYRFSDVQGQGVARDQGERPIVLNRESATQRFVDLLIPTVNSDGSIFETNGSYFRRYRITSRSTGQTCTTVETVVRIVPACRVTLVNPPANRCYTGGVATDDPNTVAAEGIRFQVDVSQLDLSGISNPDIRWFDSTFNSQTNQWGVFAAATSQSTQVPSTAYNFNGEYTFSFGSRTSPVLGRIRRMAEIFHPQTGEILCRSSVADFSIAANCSTGTSSTTTSSTVTAPSPSSSSTSTSTSSTAPTGGGTSSGGGASSGGWGTDPIIHPR